ncbi:hypothetical protein B0H11DRAFT_2059545 [Mycena galericulata]|nr:hypothetical protein B0H11DRAFT_2059545 [Mycena galericulata]
METSKTGAIRHPHSSPPTLASTLPDFTTRAQIRALLRSHSPPPDHLPSTISVVSKELASYDEQIMRWETEILRLRARLIKAKADRAELSAHHDDLCSLLAPIRRLPSEVLVEIFEWCEEEEESAQSTSVMSGLARLAQKPLLTVSQVCTRWHGIALGTPTLWDTLQLDEIDLWATPRCAKKAMALLQVALDRSATTPLHISISIIDPLDGTRPLQLLAQHSERWKTVSLFCRSFDLRHWRGVKGKLPLLETLGVEIHDKPCALDLFDIAPRLTNYTVSGRALPAVAETHLSRLVTFGCLGLEPARVQAVVLFMPRLPSMLPFRLQLFLGNWARDHITSIDLPSTSSDIVSFSMETRDYYDAPHCAKALNDVFTCLTLPLLRELYFRSDTSPLCLISWPHSAFLGLAARSSFHTHLESLFLFDVVVTEAELLESLAELPLLQRLEISDHQVIEVHGVHHLLITDTLLAALTLKARSLGLVPHLHSLTCDSLLQFDDHVYLDLLLSRRSMKVPFRNWMYWLKGHHRELDEAVVARIRELCNQKELKWEFAYAGLWAC